MYLHHFLYSYPVFKSLSLFGFLCIILYERLPHIQAAELHQVPTPPPQCLAPTLVERLAPSHDICPVTPLHQDDLYLQPQASRVAEVILPLLIHSIAMDYRVYVSIIGFCVCRLICICSDIYAWTRVYGFHHWGLIYVMFLFFQCFEKKVYITIHFTNSLR